jgi:hypothetical protein
VVIYLFVRGLEHLERDDLEVALFEPTDNLADEMRTPSGLIMTNVFSSFGFLCAM